jgi:DNA-binding transcriptional ArsR family regulator
MKLDLSALQASAHDACALLKALANPHRLMIVCTLIDGEQSVGALARVLGVRETLASQHLGLLRRDGVVAARRDGQTIYYGLQSDPARALVETLFRLFCTVPDRAHPQGPPSCSTPPPPRISLRSR